MEAISYEFRIGLPWELLHADDFVVIADSDQELFRELNRWKDGLEKKGLVVNISKTKVMVGKKGKARYLI